MAVTQKLKRVVKIHPSVLHKVSGDSVLVFHLESTSNIRTIDGLAAKMWLGFDGEKCIKEILDEVGAANAISKTEQTHFEKDGLRFVNDLLKLGLVCEN